MRLDLNNTINVNITLNNGQDNSLRGTNQEFKMTFEEMNIEYHRFDLKMLDRDSISSIINSMTLTLLP